MPAEYTAEELEEAIYDGDGYCDLGYGIDSIVELRGEDTRLEYVDGKSPCEGGGEDVYLVFRVSGGRQLFRKDGWYASHNGAEWDGTLREVHAVKREVTFYE